MNKRKIKEQIKVNNEEHINKESLNKLQVTNTKNREFFFMNDKEHIKKESHKK